MTRRTGAKYEQARDLRYAEIAKLIRADIKESKDDGRLPRLAKYSVRISTYSMGGSVDVRMSDLVRGWIPENLALCDEALCATYHTYECPGAAHLSDRGVAAMAVLQEIWDSYNYYESHEFQDGCSVNYFGDVKYDAPLGQYGPRKILTAKGS